MWRWLLWLEGTGHRTCLAVQQQRFATNDSNADSSNLTAFPGFGPGLPRRNARARSLTRNTKDET